MKGAFLLMEHDRGVRARKAPGLAAKVPSVERVTRPVPRDGMDAHPAQVEPDEMA